ncbi:MAG: hypothetical protein ABSF24_08680 [Candidatus Bathyarchaeia archaeon]
MMKIGKNMIVAIMITFCFTATMFMAIPIRSQSTSQPDPWADVSGPTAGVPDGIVNMRDIAYEVVHFNDNVSNMTRDVNVINWPTTQPEPAYQSYGVFLYIHLDDGYGGSSQYIPVYGYSRMFLSIELVNASYQGVPFNTTVSLWSVGWSGDENYTYGGWENVLQGVLNATYLGYQLPAYSQQAPAEFSTKNSYCNLIFTAVSTFAGSVQIGFYVHVYLRNE